MSCRSPGSRLLDDNRFYLKPKEFVKRLLAFGIRLSFNQIVMANF